jgi:protoheme IX farnesyltransferase
MPKPITTTPTSLQSTSILHWLTLLHQLGRSELSAMVAFSALTGQLLADRHWSPGTLVVATAVFLLATGCSALNQWQEQDLDARMERTLHRPLPSGNLSASSALAIACTSIGGGLLLLCSVPGLTAVLLGLLSVIWYNAIYTPLKRYTPFAALPGAICGALPPLIGWTATGAPLLAAEILILSGTLFVWQIPHSWLLLCHYRRDLQRSGLPDLLKKISTERLLQINNCWMAALLICYLLFPFFGIITSRLLILFFISGLAAVLFFCVRELRKKRSHITPLRIFHLVNLSMALLLLSLIIESLNR